MKTKILFICLLCIFISNCSKEDDLKYIAIDSISISPDTVSIAKNDSIQLNVNISPSNFNDKILWKSENDQIATVSEKGLVKAINIGKTTVSATSGGKTAKCVINVYINTDSIKIIPDTLIIDSIGKKIQLQVRTYPTEASPQITWSTSNKNVVTVSEKGLVESISSGNAIITATTGKKKAECYVSVSLAPLTADSIIIEPTSLTLTKKDETIQLKATLYPENIESKILWSSSNKSVASVTEDGIIKAISNGETIITATADDKTSSCKVTVDFAVESISINPQKLTLTKIGETAQLEAIVFPNDIDKEISWNSSNISVVTVNNKGMIKAMSKGEAKITATIDDKQAECDVIVDISFININGTTATISLDGASKTDIKEAISEAVANGVTNYILEGTYTILDLKKDNPFNGINAESIDFSKVTQWPKKNGITEFPDRSFMNYGNVDYSNIQKIILPKEIASIGEYAFYQCSALKTIEAEGVQEIKDFAFQYCSSLESIYFPELQTIGASCFMRTNLTKIDLPKVTTLKGMSFGFCSKLKEVNLPEVINIGEINDESATTRKGVSTFDSCSSLEIINAPKATLIGETAFSGCSSLKSVYFPEALKIGMKAFYSCKSLTEIKLPKANWLGSEIFSYSNNLIKLDLLTPNSITTKDVTFNKRITINVDLLLNKSKEEEVEGTKWKGHTWKSISFTNE